MITLCCGYCHRRGRRRRHCRRGCCCHENWWTKQMKQFHYRRPCCMVIVVHSVCDMSAFVFCVPPLSSNVSINLPFATWCVVLYLQNSIFFHRVKKKSHLLLLYLGVKGMDSDQWDLVWMLNLRNVSFFSISLFVWLSKKWRNGSVCSSFVWSSNVLVLKGLPFSVWRFHSACAQFFVCFFFNNFHVWVKPLFFLFIRPLKQKK